MLAFALTLVRLWRTDKAWQELFAMVRTELTQCSVEREALRGEVNTLRGEVVALRGSKHVELWRGRSEED